jgi:L,D-peptidoglycan transpeptidase YkuD (ErfK/YbiS/YcfS/YnhG family)
MVFSKANKPVTAFVRPLVSNRRLGVISIGSLRLRCALGRSGVSMNKREGDGATPRATLKPLRIFYRFDQTLRPMPCNITSRVIRRDDGWCDAPLSSAYNRLVKLPFPWSHETLWRKDHLYDLVIETDWNHRPRRPFHGSAIFIHLAREGYQPTEGCIALSRRDMRLLLAQLHRIRGFKIG